MICANRTDTPGFFTSCRSANGDEGCVCGKQVEAELKEAACATQSA